MKPAYVPPAVIQTGVIIVPTDNIAYVVDKKDKGGVEIKLKTVTQGGATWVIFGGTFEELTALVVGPKE